MDLHSQITNRLSLYPSDEIIKKMGYRDPRNGIKTLQAFLESDLYEWLSTSHYDLKYTSEGFLIKICEVLEIVGFSIEIDQTKDDIDRIRHMQQPSIFIYTGFKRTTEPTLILALLESKRNIIIDKKMIYNKPDAEVTTIISSIIQEHHNVSNGELKVWGKIISYIYNDHKGNKIIFYADGRTSK